MMTHLLGIRIICSKGSETQKYTNEDKTHGNNEEVNQADPTVLIVLPSGGRKQNHKLVVKLLLVLMSYNMKLPKFLNQLHHFNCLHNYAMRCDTYFLF